MEEKKGKYIVAVIGAGSAGIFAARELAACCAEVILINRDIKPGGLAEYGIYYNKYKLKEGLRKQFRQILEMPDIHYYGNVTVGQNGDLKLDELRALGVQAIMVTVGAQGTKWLGLPGEDLKGVYHAKDIVYHYNKLPPFSTQQFDIGKRVALVGVGNVMMDIAHWTIRDVKADEVIAVARRGPVEVKFSKKELEPVAGNLDLEALDAELERCRPQMESVGQDVQKAREYFLSGMSKAIAPSSATRFRFDFLASPTSILGDERGEVCGLEVEDTMLARNNGSTKAIGTGMKRVLDVDTVVFCIGDKVDESVGLPVKNNEYVRNPDPCCMIEGVSYEVYDPQAGRPIEGMFIAGWSREASSGLVGIARKDGEHGAHSMMKYLEMVEPLEDHTPVFDGLEALLKRSGKHVVSKEDFLRLRAVEQTEAGRLGLEDFKLKTNEEMLAAIASA